MKSPRECRLNPLGPADWGGEPGFGDPGPAASPHPLFLLLASSAGGWVPASRGALTRHPSSETRLLATPRRATPGGLGRRVTGDPPRRPDYLHNGDRRFPRPSAELFSPPSPSPPPFSPGPPLSLADPPAGIWRRAPSGRAPRRRQGAESGGTWGRGVRGRAGLGKTPGALPGANKGSGCRPVKARSGRSSRSPGGRARSE